MKKGKRIFSGKVYFLMLLVVIFYGLSFVLNPILYAADEADAEKSQQTSESGSDVWVDEEDNYFSEWNPREDMAKMQKNMGEMFRNMLKHGLSRSWSENRGEGYPEFDPNIDIKEAEGDYFIYLDLPGMDKSKIYADVTDNILTIHGEREIDVEEKSEDTDGEYKYYRRERSFGKFQRSITLPENADTDKIAAKYDNGVLVITVPKKKIEEEPKKTKDIKIL